MACQRDMYDLRRLSQPVCEGTIRAMVNNSLSYPDPVLEETAFLWWKHNQGESLRTWERWEAMKDRDFLKRMYRIQTKKRLQRGEHWPWANPGTV